MDLLSSIMNKKEKQEEKDCIHEEVSTLSLSQVDLTFNKQNHTYKLQISTQYYNTAIFQTSKVSNTFEKEILNRNKSRNYSQI